MGQLFRRASIALALAIATLGASPARAGERVDLLLVLAADVSRSVDSQKFQLQREGYAAALSNPRVLDTIQSGRRGRIGVLFLEWSGFGNQKVVIDWMMIDGPKAAQAFGDRLLESPRSYADRTSISGGIDAAVAQLARAPFDAERRTIDVSGDGTNNAGRNVGQARDEALALGISINGLAILSEIPLPWNPEHTNPPGGLPKYYRDNVIGGPGSFVLEAKDFNSFGEAIIKKMIAEIADVRPPGELFVR
jgi:Protein of unknown function (DUF1194)